MAHVADHLSVSALEQQYRSCTDVTAARHRQTIWLLAKGHEMAEVAATVSYAQRWVERLLARYNAQGPQALGDLRRRNGTSPSVLRPDLLDKLKARLREPPPRWWPVDQPEGGGLDGGRTRACCGLAPTWLGGAQSDQWVGAEAPPPPSRRGHAGGAGGVQKKLEQAVAEARAQHPDTPIEVWATDEHRIGLKPILRRVWAPKGQRPIALVTTGTSGCTSPPSCSRSRARPSGPSRTGCPSRSLPRCWRCLRVRPGRDGIASSCSGSTAPAGTPRPTWLCRMGSGSPTCPRTRPSFSRLSTSGPSSTSHSPTSTSRRLLISSTL